MWNVPSFLQAAGRWQLACVRPVPPAQPAARERGFHGCRNLAVDGNKSGRCFLEALPRFTDGIRERGPGGKRRGENRIKYF